MTLPLMQGERKKRNASSLARFARENTHDFPRMDDIQWYVATKDAT